MRRAFAAAALVALLAGACAPTPAATPGGALRVVASFSVIADFARVVGGDQIALTVMVGPGMDAHTFEPTPADARALAQAQVVLENGLGFEPWLDGLYSASDSRAVRVVVTQGITRRPGDPHVWHNVAHAEQMVANIRAAFAQADPAHAAVFQANADAYLAQLRALDEWVAAQTQTLPDARRKLVTTHDTFGYFADRYGFVVVGSVLPATTEGASPSAQQLAALVEQIRAQGVPAVFAENVSANTVLNQVAAEAGVTVVASLYTDALGPSGSPGDTYLHMMRYNVETIVGALSP
jgi:ABC-type Zn uptake system ZnuABC Zn-binding protein ZnuA